MNSPNPPPSPAERLRRAADLVERRAAETAAEPWALTHVRAALVPWVALMTPDLAPPLAAWLHEAADQCARAYDDLTAEQGPVLAELLPAMTSDEAVAHVARLWRRPLALADVILRGETQ